MIESDRSTPAINMDEVLSSLKDSHTLGYESLKPQQIAVIKGFVPSLLLYLLGTESLFALQFFPYIVFDCLRPCYPEQARPHFCKQQLTQNRHRDVFVNGSQART